MLFASPGACVGGPQGSGRDMSGWPVLMPASSLALRKPAVVLSGGLAVRDGGAIDAGCGASRRLLDLTGSAGTFQGAAAFSNVSARAWTGW